VQSSFWIVVMDTSMTRMGRCLFCVRFPHLQLLYFISTTKFRTGLILDVCLAWMGRRKTLLAYTLICVVGAVRNFTTYPLVYADMCHHRYCKLSLVVRAIAGLGTSMAVASHLALESAR
jgi:hypothetical protein